MRKKLRLYGMVKFGRACCGLLMNLSIVVTAIIQSEAELLCKLLLIHKTKIFTQLQLVLSKKYSQR